MSLAEFRADLAETLTKHGSQRENKRGRPSTSSIEEALTKKKKNVSLPAMPTKDIRLDKVGHEQIRTDSRRRCQFSQCKLLSYIKCLKCHVYHCYKKNVTVFTCFITIKPS